MGCDECITDCGLICRFWCNGCKHEDEGERSHGRQHSDGQYSDTQYSDRHYSDNAARSVDCFVKTAPECDLMGADQTLWEKVAKRLKSSGIKFRKTEGPDLTGQAHSTKTLILCPVISRLGSNAEHAMKGITGDKNMALLCFHPISPHRDFTDDSKSALQDDKFKSLGAIVDVVFWQVVGMYECTANQSAVNKICGFIRSN